MSKLKERAVNRSSWKKTDVGPVNKFFPVVRSSGIHRSRFPFIFHHPQGSQSIGKFRVLKVDMAWIHWRWTSYSCPWLSTESRIWVQKKHCCLLEWIVPNIDSRGRKRYRRDQGKDIERWAIESRCSSVQHFEYEIVSYVLVIKWRHSNAISL